MQKQILITNHLSVGVVHELISDIQVMVAVRDRVGIIGPNGSGKTTLFRTIMGSEESFTGTVVVQGTIEYVGQYDLVRNQGGCTVAEFCTKKAISPEILITYLKETFKFSCNQEIQLDSYSGGQRAMIAIGCGLLKNPDLLLLDEPTNHLDVTARKKLVEVLKKFPGAILCISHDAWFLGELTNRLWIISDNSIRTFMGSYKEYKVELQKNVEARERKLGAVQKERRKLDDAVAQEQVRSARSKREGRKQIFDRSMSRMAIGGLKRAAEKAAARNKKLFDRKAEDIHQKISELSTKKRKAVSGSIVGTEEKGALVRIRDAKLSVFGKELHSTINLELERGERVAITGDNGSGKSSLVKAILGVTGFELVPTAYMSKSARIEYLDQQYVLIDREKSVLNNVLDFSGATPERARQHLSHFLFSDGREVLKPAKTLSGGMLARLAFVMLTIAPIDLLILDEPTNNLDMETIEAITVILSDYKGGLIVISHDQEFLEQIGISSHVKLSKGD